MSRESTLLLFKEIPEGPAGGPGLFVSKVYVNNGLPPPRIYATPSFRLKQVAGRATTESIFTRTP